MFSDGATPYGNYRYELLLAEAEHRRLVKSLPKRPSVPARIARNAVLALAALIGR